VGSAALSAALALSLPLAALWSSLRRWLWGASRTGGAVSWCGEHRAHGQHCGTTILQADAPSTARSRMQILAVSQGKTSMAVAQQGLAYTATQTSPQLHLRLRLHQQQHPGPTWPPAPPPAPPAPGARSCWWPAQAQRLSAAQSCQRWPPGSQTGACSWCWSRPAHPPRSRTAPRCRQRCPWRGQRRAGVRACVQVVM
jgi:hypothetical protein